MNKQTQSNKPMLGSTWYRLRKANPLTVLYCAVMVLIAIVYLFPLFWLGDASFRPAIEIFNVPPVYFKEPLLKAFSSYSLDTYIKALTEWNIGMAFVMSTIVTVCATIMTLVVCSLCAYAFSFIEFPGRNVLFYFVLGTMMIPMVTMITPLYQVLRTLHLTDNLMGIMLPYVVSGFGVFLLRQFYIKIPKSLLESAKIDGAGHFRIWWGIILPLSKPALAALSIVQFRLLWNDFLIPMIVLKSDFLYTLPIRIQVIDGVNFNKPYDVIIASGFIAALIPMVVFLMFQKQFIEGLTGGTKG